jgi:hypothetical protein
MKPRFIAASEFRIEITAEPTLLRKSYRATVGPNFSFVDSKGHRYRPAADTFLHNMGSIPWLFQFIPALQKDRFPISYACHDEAWATLKVRKYNDVIGAWETIKCSRSESNRILKEMIQAEKGLNFTSYVVRTGVMFGALYCDILEVFGAARKDMTPCPS